MFVMRKMNLQYISPFGSHCVSHHWCLATLVQHNVCDYQRKHDRKLKANAQRCSKTKSLLQNHFNWGVT